MTRFPFIALALTEYRAARPRRVGDDRPVGAHIVGDFQPAFDDPHRSRAVRQYRQDRLLVDPIGLRHADRDLHLHRIDRQANCIRHAEPIMPERVPQRAHRRLGVVGSADVGSHADLEHHTLQSHVRLASIRLTL